jgi:hypothetical protein
LVRLENLNRSYVMNREHEVLEVRRGSERVRSVWLAPAPLSTQHTPAPASAGQWIEKQPNTYARVTAAVPVTVGSTLRIF